MKKTDVCDIVVAERCGMIVLLEAFSILILMDYDTNQKHISNFILITI